MTFERIGPPRVQKRRPRVLYIEDDEINFELAFDMLADFELYRANGSRQAFVMTRNDGPYDLLLVDIALADSDLDGINVLKLLRGQPIDAAVPEYAADVLAPDTPAIFVTGFIGVHPREELIAAGGADVFAKPVDFDRLDRRMRELLGAAS